LIIFTNEYKKFVVKENFKGIDLTDNHHPLKSVDDNAFAK
jgi:hypothetical protein